MMSHPIRIYAVCKIKFSISAVQVLRSWVNDMLPFLILYFFAYKMEFFFFQNNPKNLDPSYKMDLDLWDCLGRVKLVLLQNCKGLI